MGWKAYEGPAKGLEVVGDATVPATRWWNHLWLLWFQWKLVAILEPDMPFGYKIGYRDFHGHAMLLDKLLSGRRIRVRLGREDCNFFVVNQSGEEIPLTLVVRTTLDDPDYEHLPLL